MGREVAKPDLTTPDIPGAIPSIQGEGTTDLDLGESPVEPAPETTSAAGTAAPTATTPQEAAPATAAEAAAAPVAQAEAANAGADATPPTEDGTTDATPEEKA